MIQKAKMSSSTMLSGINLDERQTFLFELFEDLANSLNTTSFVKSITPKFMQKSSTRGVYLYGNVGRGKTMLMNMFFEMILVKKEIIHFQKFMQELHHKMHKFQLNNGSEQVVKNLADEIAERVKVLCIDEFEIKDITDAMLVMRLFSFLSLNGVFIFLTTNIIPDNLYKDGLQRVLFLPFIENIKKKFLVLDLDTKKDYRLEKVADTRNKILFPVNEDNKTTLDKIKNNLCSKQELHSGEFEVFGRQVVFPQTHQNILFTNFDELFMQDFGYADYVNLCQRFTIIVLEGVRQISESETDIVTRFINFVDNAYFYKVLLFSLLETKPSLIYTAGKSIAEFQRTISRLNEMNSINEKF
ncbi:MAG: cell division protein ZapE [Rickettsiaceae bacterium]